jgi:hypothetical protein
VGNGKYIAVEVWIGIDGVERRQRLEAKTRLVEYIPMVD